MARTTDFHPFEVDHNSPVGTILQINTVRATVPADLLPRRVQLQSSWRNVGGARAMNWFAQHDGGVISLPTILGDGSQALAQLVEWLGRHGYRDVTPGLGDPMEFERPETKE
jgi:hypothetical protein